jgi:hypothetical protein
MSRIACKLRLSESRREEARVKSGEEHKNLGYGTSASGAYYSSIYLMETRR